MKKLLLLFLLAAGLIGFKQNAARHLYGTVCGKDDGLPIPGVSVKIKGTNTGTVTAVNGTYNVNVPDSYATLVFSYIGYQTQEIKVGKQDKINVFLQPSSATLGEVVVTGYSTMQKRDITGSITKNIPSSATAQLLQGQSSGIAMDKSINGKVSGLAISPSGAPGSSAQIYGMALNNADPGDESYKNAYYQIPLQA